MHKLDKLFIELNLNKKQEILKFSILEFAFVFAGVFTFIFFKNFLYLIYGIIAAGAVVLFFILRYLRMKQKLNDSKIEEFVKLFTFFKSFLNNKYNVYQSLNNISFYASPYMKDKLETLLKEIDEDKSVNPYIHFASNFSLLVIEQLMVSIFQMVEEGENEKYLNQFELLFSKISGDFYTKNLRNKEKSLGNLTLFPLIGAGLVVIIITISIIFVIGGYVNG